MGPQRHQLDEAKLPGGLLRPSLPTGSRLLTRDQFRETVFKRDRGRCVICGKQAVDAHHIIDRKLWDNGGYFVENGASLCEEHHLAAEMTTLSVEDVRAAVGITEIILPPGFSNCPVDKWGNRILPDGSRLRGPLFNEEGVQRILRQGGVLEQFAMSRDIIKYPRTPHIEGSRLQHGDEDLSQFPFSQLAGRFLVVEEKIDGANAGISFVGGKLHLQSRGHYLVGGDKRHFNPLKPWANAFASVMYEVLGERYVMYGEWMYAKHTCFYDALPHYFLEFDIFDTENGVFLSTPRRHEMLDYMRLYMPVCSVPVLARGQFTSLDDIIGLVQPSLYKTPQWRDRLREQAEASGVSWEDAQRETNMSDLSEGLYIKHEDEDRIIELSETDKGRYKYVRADFLNSILDSGTHWDQRPIVPNCLDKGVDLYKAA